MYATYVPNLSYFKAPLPEVMKNSINFKTITIKNHDGAKSINTSAKVEKIINKKSQITSTLEPSSITRLYFRAQYPSKTSLTMVKENITIKLMILKSKTTKYKNNSPKSILERDNALIICLFMVSHTLTH